MHSTRVDSDTDADASALTGVCAPVCRGYLVEAGPLSQEGEMGHPNQVPGNCEGGGEENERKRKRRNESKLDRRHHPTSGEITLNKDGVTNGSAHGTGVRK
jgi:hypothetical protein